MVSCERTHQNENLCAVHHRDLKLHQFSSILLSHNKDRKSVYTNGATINKNSTVQILQPWRIDRSDIFDSSKALLTRSPGKQGGSFLQRAGECSCEDKSSTFALLHYSARFSQSYQQTTTKFQMIYSGIDGLLGIKSLSGQSKSPVHTSAQYTSSSRNCTLELSLYLSSVQLNKRSPILAHCLNVWLILTTPPIQQIIRSVHNFRNSSRIAHNGDSALMLL